ncbi:MAG: CdaR family protein [Bacteroidia bacterium]|nr:CdaR family protein [Bacteroidia bacterium]
MAAAKNKYALQSKKPGKTKAFFICLLIAVFLWFVHALNSLYFFSFKVPVEFRNMPVNKRPMVTLPSHITVDVKASGLKLALIQLNETQRPFVIDFNGLKSVSRDQNFILSTSQLNLNKRFRFETQILSINPDTLYFGEKTGFQKIVPVKVPLFVKCKEGYGYKRPLLQPAFITIWGDTNTIEKIDTLYTQALSLNNLSQNTQAQLQLIKPSTEVHTATNEVLVKLDVARLIQESITIPVHSLKSLPNQQVRLFPSNVKVTFTSLQNSFSISDTVLFKALINIDKVNTTTNKCPVFLGSKPNQVTVLDIEPKEVELLILKN